MFFFSGGGIILTCNMKLYAEAGTLYEKCQSWDKAAAVYTKIKNW